MFEQWPEPRRRWFLLTFCAVSWTFFANALAHLGAQVSQGGIGPDGVHAVGIVGTIALWTAVIGAVKLPMRHWVFATLAGITLSSALVSFGFRDGAAATIWSAECDRGNGPACAQLADFYDSGRSPLHGWLDAQRAHSRACEFGVASSCRDATVGAQMSLHERCFHERVATDCAALSAQLNGRGLLDEMYEVDEYACAELQDLNACESLLSSGFHGRRLAACDVLVPHCRVSSALDCSVTLRRCDRIESPHAGVD